MNWVPTTPEQRFRIGLGASLASLLSSALFASLEAEHTFVLVLELGLWLLFTTFWGWKALPPPVPSRVFSIAKDFSAFPAGRTMEDGPYSGEALRGRIVHELRQGPLTIDFDGTLGYGSSFLEGAFENLAAAVPIDGLSLKSKDSSILREVWSYINRVPIPLYDFVDDADRTRNER